MLVSKLCHLGDVDGNPYMTSSNTSSNWLTEEGHATVLPSLGFPTLELILSSMSVATR